MFSGLLLFNGRGEVLIGRFYRDDVSRRTADAFRMNVIKARNPGPPIQFIDGTTFMYVRYGDLYIVGMTKMNSNPTLVLQFMYQLVDVFKAYFGGKFDEQTIRENFVLIYELLDETADGGYPQIVSPTLLAEFIKVGSIKNPRAVAASSNQISAQITGAIDWRQPGKYKYRKNEVFIDVLESVNLLLSVQGQVLRSDVAGKVVMKTYLTGMPECKFGMNDKVVMEKESKATTARRRTTGIAIDDLTFHRCVRLGKFDQDRTISFIPPDGEFDLMKYRITENINLPFQIIPIVSEHSLSRVEYEIKIKGNFSSKLFATNLVMRIPVPSNTANHNFKVQYGRVKYDAATSHMLWKIRKFPGNQAYILKGEVTLTQTISKKAWSRPPIELDFQVPMFTSSGLSVRFLRVFEKSNFATVKWVRYITRAGNYQIRI